MSDDSADLFDFNLMQSVLYHVRKSEFVTSHGYAVTGKDRSFNPATLTRWVQIEWVFFGPRRTTRNTFHARFFSRDHTDRFGRLTELMIGRFKSVMSAATDGIPVYDFVNSPDTPVALTYGGNAIVMAVRFGDRGPTMDGTAFMEDQSAAKGVSVDVLSYNIHVARPHEIH